MSTNVPNVPALVDPADLVDARIIAELLGLSSPRAISVYRARYPDFPAPAVDMGAGRCLLWLRADIEQWNRARA